MSQDVESEPDADQRRRTYDRVIRIVEQNTGAKQPATVDAVQVKQVALHAGIPASRASSALRAAVDNDDLARFSGTRYCIRDQGSVLAVIEEERESDDPDRSVVARANAVLSKLRGEQ